MKRKMDIDKWKLESGIKSDLDKEGMPFTVPENYFEELPGIIISRIKDSGNNSIRKSWHKTETMIRLAAAASFVLIAFVYFSKTQFKTTDTEAMYSSLQDYLLEEVDEETIISYITETSNVATEKTTDIENELLNDIDETLIIEEL